MPPQEEGALLRERCDRGRLEGQLTPPTLLP